MSHEEFANKYNTGPSLYYTGGNKEERIAYIREHLDQIRSNPLIFVKEFLGVELKSWQEVFFTEHFKYFSKVHQDRVNTLIENGVIVGAENYQFKDSNVVEVVGNAFICRSPKGYYASTPEDFYMASPYFSTIEDLKASDVLSFMNNVYKSNHPKITDGGVD